MQFTDNASANMFISWQTYEGTNIKFLLIAGCPYVLTERFCQDPLENNFGRQRSMGHRKGNPSVQIIRSEPKKYLDQLQETVVMMMKH